MAEVTKAVVVLGGSVGGGRIPEGVSILFAGHFEWLLSALPVLSQTPSDRERFQGALSNP